MPEPMMLVFVGAVALFAFTVQGVLGFAGAILAIPVLLWAGLDLPTIVGLITPLGLVQCLAGLIRYRHEIHWRDAAGLTLWRAVTLPVGVWLMSVMVAIGPELVKQVVGIGVLIAVAIRVGLRVKPRHHVHPAWTMLAGWASGLTAGMVGMGGPPMVLWVTAHDWTAQRARTVTWMSIVVLAPLIVVLLTLEFGTRLLAIAAIGLAMSPITIMAMSLAAWLNQWVPAHRLRGAMLGALVVTGCATVIQPWIGG